MAIVEEPTTPPEIGGIGHRVRRHEDARLIEGQGNFLDDIVLPNMLHLAILRSPVAHARITGIDTSAAEALDGVVAVVTGALAAAGRAPRSRSGLECLRGGERALAAGVAAAAGDNSVAAAAAAAGTGTGTSAGAGAGDAATTTGAGTGETIGCAA